MFDESLMTYWNVYVVPMIPTSGPLPLRCWVSTGPVKFARSATPSGLIVWAGFAPTVSVTASSPSDKITPLNVGTVPTSAGARPRLWACWPCATGYVITSNKCAPGVVEIAIVHVVDEEPVTHDPPVTVVVPTFAYTVVSVGGVPGTTFPT